MMSSSISRGELWLNQLAPNAAAVKGCARPCRRQTPN
jgi:hypothetical protein